MGRENAQTLKAWTYLDHPKAFTLIPNPVMKQVLSGEVEGGRLKPIPRLVYLALLTRARLEWKETTPQDLALLLGLDRRTVEKALLELWEQGLAERGEVGWWAPLHPLQAEAHAVQVPVHAVQGAARENAVQEGVSCHPEVIEEEIEEPPHPSHPPTPPSAEGEEVSKVWQEKALEENPARFPPPSVEAEAAQGAPEEASPLPGTPQASPALVKPGTKSLRAALEGAGLWREFWRVFRPGFATPALFGAWLHRLEREALPLGAAFLEAVAKTVEGARRGVVRYPAAYLERLLQEAAPPEGASPLPPASEPPSFRDGDLLLLPDGRRGYFAGWTGGGRLAFVEADGVAYTVPREVLALARVLG